jgi:hypothetical protein
VKKASLCLLSFLLIIFTVTYANTSRQNLTAQTIPKTITPDTFSATGNIGSLIFLTSGSKNFNIFTHEKFILAGDWNLSVNKGIVNYFAANMSTALANGSRSHYHALTNFHPSKNEVVRLTPDNNLSFRGTIDVSLNNEPTWNNTKTTVLIANGKTITIFLDDNDTGHHFLGQPIYGMVKSIK